MTSFSLPQIMIFTIVINSIPTTSGNLAEKLSIWQACGGIDIHMLPELRVHPLCLGVEKEPALLAKSKRES